MVEEKPKRMEVVGIKGRQADGEAAETPTEMWAEAAERQLAEAAAGKTGEDEEEREGCKAEQDSDREQWGEIEEGEVREVGREREVGGAREKGRERGEGGERE
uniref:Uncharacterized protein n=1 Tax=Strombidinopsis acuminata TaxID=141414 RepID=A0A7S3WXM6_9SPIT|mmetsp:Transcript_13925/g.42477  ORF Transcript_13925/g.42477 Transcript_13925/m.42477 type:complete len:103 (-) Transcript_13925:227-535(-)